MQTHADLDLSPALTSRSWHPKLTPYRLLVLGTTIGVGTAKTVEAQHGDQDASTTLEWVSGVAIFLLLYSMSTYDESPKEPPPLIRWLFTVDCMPYLWRLLSLLHIPCPSYLSEPWPAFHSAVISQDQEHKTNPTAITLYRLLVCFTTAVFGLTKAAMSYLGHSAAANWIDWTLGVVVTSTLFVLGMYENNAVGMWHTFFVPDYSTETQYIFIAATASVGSLGFLVLIRDCIWIISLMWSRPQSLFFSTAEVPVRLSSLTPIAMLGERLFDAFLTLVALPMIALFALPAISVIAVAMSLLGFRGDRTSGGG